MNKTQIEEFILNTTKGADKRQEIFNLASVEIRAVIEKKKEFATLGYDFIAFVNHWINLASFFKINDDSFSIFSYFMLAKNCSGRLASLDGSDIIVLNAIFTEKEITIFNKLARGVLHI